MWKNSICKSYIFILLNIFIKETLIVKEKNVIELGIVFLLHFFLFVNVLEPQIQGPIIVKIQDQMTKCILYARCTLNAINSKNMIIGSRLVLMHLQRGIQTWTWIWHHRWWRQIWKLTNTFGTIPKNMFSLPHTRLMSISWIITNTPEAADNKELFSYQLTFM